MTKKEFFLKSLYEVGNMNTSYLTNKYYEECESDIEEKRRYYIGKNNEKTEKELKTQIKGEFSACTNQPWNKNFQYISFDDSKTANEYFLTSDGRKYYEETYLEDKIIDIDTQIKVDLKSTDNVEFPSFGIVYLLKSRTFEDTYKVGITGRTMEKRLEDLKRDNRYGLFDFYPVMYIKCADYEIIERVLHKFFENYRLCKKNNLLVDTEIFKGLGTIEIEFELFANFLKSNPRYSNVELIKL